MSALINDGGAAFPRPDTEKFFGEEGMSLRDYFAAKAMSALLTQSRWSDLSSNHDMVADYAYDMAEAMLKAREL